MEEQDSVELEPRLVEIAQELQVLAKNAKQPAMEVSLKRAGVLIEALAEQAHRYS